MELAGEPKGSGVVEYSDRTFDEVGAFVERGVVALSFSRFIG